MALSEPAEFGHPDFILLDEVSEAAFMVNLKLRYEKGKVCVYILVITTHNINELIKLERKCRCKHSVRNHKPLIVKKVVEKDEIVSMFDA